MRGCLSHVERHVSPQIALNMSEQGNDAVLNGVPDICCIDAGREIELIDDGETQAFVCPFNSPVSTPFPGRPVLTVELAIPAASLQVRERTNPGIMPFSQSG